MEPLSFSIHLYLTETVTTYGTTLTLQITVDMLESASCIPQ